MPAQITPTPPHAETAPPADQAGRATAQDKAATLTMTLKADSGYESVEVHRVSAGTWARIVALASGGAT
ncbi:hypothetical protein [Paracoccus aminophilus]|nr:hypothetical protein [Paracoccus aminophilus]